MAGDAISAIGSINQGKADSMAGEYNAQSAEQNAAYSIQQARENERRQRIVSKKFLGDIRASYGASGITADASALDILEESAANAELDALTIRHEGEAKATGYRNEARYARVAGENAKTASYLKAAGYVASGVEKGMGYKADSDYRSKMLEKKKG